MRTPILLPACSALLACTIAAQTPVPPDAPLAFEVASARQDTKYSWVRRPWSPDINCSPIGHCGVSGNRFTEDFASLTDLIMDAFSVRRYQIIGLPNWGDTGHDVYAIAATAPGEGTLPLAQARRMLQTLLADRFQLKLHHETRELPVYALVPAKNGPRLAPRSKVCNLPGATFVTRGGGRGDGKAGDGKPQPVEGGRDLGLLSSWALMPELLAMYTDRPVIDKSGLQEPAYCTADGNDPLMVLVMGLAPGPGRGVDPQPRSVDADAGAPSIFTLIEEKWGMRLEPQKAPVDVLVIDHVDRPSEN